MSQSTLYAQMVQGITKHIVSIANDPGKLGHISRSLLKAQLTQMHQVQVSAHYQGTKQFFNQDFFCWLSGAPLGALIDE